MQFSKSIIQIIQERTSWRTYRNKPLDEETKNQIENILKLKGIESPFKSSAGQSRLKLISLPDIDPEKNIKIGTYGMIKGAREFIAGATKKVEYDLENYGYLFETIILGVTDLGLGSCWLGGTFNRSQFSDLLQLNENEVIPAITPVGYPAPRRWKEIAIRSFAKAKIRKTWEQIFFLGDFSMTVNQDEIGTYKTILEMVRIGPSAGNRQPWRIIKEKERDIYHFFVKSFGDKSFNVYEQFVRLDIGIAICHFDLSAKELGISGKWEFTKPNLGIPKDLKYIISWIGE
jgi:nitroreductase